MIAKPQTIRKAIDALVGTECPYPTAEERIKNHWRKQKAENLRTLRGLLHGQTGEYK